MEEEKEKSIKKENAKKTVDKQKDAQENKGLAILSYIGILFILPLLLKPNSEFIKFHVKQGIILTIGWVIGMILYPLFGLGFLIHIVVIVFSIMGIINVSEGTMKELPIIGELAKKLNF